MVKIAALFLGLLALCSCAVGPLAAEMARRGYVSLSIDYRLRAAPVTDWPGAFRDATADAAAALDWLAANAIRLRIDMTHVAYIGHSAGGMTVANLCYREPVNVARWKKRSVFAVIPMSGSSLAPGGTGTGSVRIGWNDKDPGHVYFAAVVVDDTPPEADPVMGEVWRNDSFEVLLFEASIDVRMAGSAAPAGARAFSLEAGRACGNSAAYNDCEKAVRKTQTGWTKAQFCFPGNLGKVTFTP